MLRRYRKTVSIALFVLLMIPVSCRVAEFGGVGAATMREMARGIDELERCLELYGSVVVKQPDVWGQARLSKYRDEYEQEMAKDLPNFQFTLNGSVSGSDQAYLADAAALSAAASGSQATIQKPKGSPSTATSTTTNSLTFTPGTLTLPSSAVYAATKPATAGPGASPITPLDLPDASANGTFGAFSNVTRNAVPAPAQLTFAGANNGISLEPPLLLDQKSQYLNHLHELRRINEGDDTADSPGYSLNLVRIPVSILPGKKTDVGHGAEVTLSLRPFLNDELLPTTFRNLVINDLIDQLSFPVTQFINDPDNAVYLDPAAANDLHALFFLLDHFMAYFKPLTKEEIALGSSLPTDLFVEQLVHLRWKPSLEEFFKRNEWQWIDVFLHRWEELQQRQITDENKRVELQPFLKQYALTKIVLLRNLVSQSKSRRAQMPFPPEQLISIYGFDSYFSLVTSAAAALSKERFSRTAVDADQVYAHLPDVQGYLREKLAAAYELLKQDTNQDLWNNCVPEAGLTSSIRNDDLSQIESQRNGVLRRMSEQSTRGLTTPALTWAILVEAALLNDRLAEDMHQSASLKGCAIDVPPCPEFYRPNPPADALHAFNQYVQCRWPIHVFALDPAAQEQNLQSTFSTRREMQLALSLAFVNGRVSARNMLNYARRLEFDYATIDLNGTAIGFSHGEDTFGWRFYPRFQAPDIESNAKTAMRLICGGANKDAILKQRRLEPGTREVYCIVIMPSFVPYATLNVSSSWFDLANPRAKKLNSTRAIELGQRVKCLQQNSQCVSDSYSYRDNDLYHLNEKVRQLESRLPFQTTQVQVPYENTLGGFAMFNAGVTELAPELVGFYGTSAINPNYGGTVFLVGDHFSVHSTTVIAGGQAVATTDQHLLSRQVMQVKIPAHPMLVGDHSAQFIDVQLATPYGITQHLLIPAVTPKDASAGSLSPSSITQASANFSSLQTGATPTDQTSGSATPSTAAPATTGKAASKTGNNGSNTDNSTNSAPTTSDPAASNPGSTGGKSTPSGTGGTGSSSSQPGKGKTKPATSADATPSARDVDFN